MFTHSKGNSIVISIQSAQFIWITIKTFYYQMYRYIKIWTSLTPDLIRIFFFSIDLWISNSGILLLSVYHIYFSFIILYINQVVSSFELFDNQIYGSCYQIVRFYVCWRLFLLQFGVFDFKMFSCFSSYSRCISIGSVCNPNLFSLNQLMTFEQRYTTLTVVLLLFVILGPYIAQYVV